jgi:hypothetical protein
MKQLKVIVPLAGLFFLLTACSTSRITHSWQAADAPTKTFNKVMVLGVLKDGDRSLQDRMENHLAGDLRDLGYNVVTSLSEYGPKAFDGMDEKAVMDKLQNSGIDAVITIVLLDKAKERYYVPSRIYYSPYVIYYRRFWGYYTTVYDRIYSPGYYQENTKYFWESNFYEVTSRELLYSVQTESFDPSSAESLAHEYGRMIVKDMLKHHVLARQSTTAFIH